MVLPEVLHEISGITAIDAITIGCIQDEQGILFLYDLNQKKIISQQRFYDDGDYEGIACAGKTIYILRSDGLLVEIVDYKSNPFQIKTYHTGIPTPNNEGLCYDAVNNRLLIAAKSRLGKGPEQKDKRVIYGFDLRNKKLAPEPVFSFDLEEIKSSAKSAQINLPSKTKKKGGSAQPAIRLFTSAISFHPLSKKLYLLSASDHMLIIFNASGKMEHLEQLNPSLFNKPEGITFLTNGDMYISNEGQDAKPTLLHFPAYNAASE